MICLSRPARFSLLLLVAVVPLALAQSAKPPGHPYASQTPVIQPTVFGPGVISTGAFDSHPAFTPDGATIYFLRSTPNFNHWTILSAQYRKGRWNTPAVVPFSGQYSDADPFITPDGAHLYFISNRTGAGKTSTDLDIWTVDKTNTGWTEPRNLGSPINSAGNEWYPTIAANGTIYFGSDRQGGKGRTDIYRSRFVNGKYAEPENLGDAINTQFNEFEALISPDESFLILMAGGRSDSKGGFDLYISYNRNGVWTKPVNLGDKINSSGNEYSPTISPDGKYFFWTSTRTSTDAAFEKQLNYHELMAKLENAGNGLGDIYYIDLSVLNIGR